MSKKLVIQKIDKIAQGVLDDIKSYTPPTLITPVRSLSNVEFDKS